MGFLETREPKSVTAGIQGRGEWDVIRDRGNKSSGVTKNVLELTSPVENWILCLMALVTKVFNEPSRRRSSSGVIA